MFEFWADLPWWMKYGVAFLVLGVAYFVYRQGVFSTTLWGLGFVFLIFAIIGGDNR